MCLVIMATFSRRLPHGSRQYLLCMAAPSRILGLLLYQALQAMSEKHLQG